MNKKTETVVIRMDKEMKDKIHQLAKKNRRTVSDYLRILLEDTIKENTHEQN